MSPTSQRETISTIANAYFAFLLYKNNVIKSSSFSVAQNRSEFIRKLSFFLKTQWRRELDAENTEVSDVRSQHSYIRIIPNQKLSSSDLRRAICCILRGRMFEYLEQHNLPKDSSFLVFEIMPGSATSFSVFIGETDLIAGVISENINSLRGSQDVQAQLELALESVNIKDKYDECYNRLIFAKDHMPKIVKEWNAIEESIISLHPGVNFSALNYDLSPLVNMRWSLKQISLYMKCKEVESNRVSGTADSARIDAFKSALGIAIASLESAGRADEIETYQFANPMLIIGLEAHYYWLRSTMPNKEAVVNEAITELEAISTSTLASRRS